MEITKETMFVATLREKDERTDYPAGTQFYPKGVYWHKKNVILVGSIAEDHTVRLAFPADIVKVEIR